MYSAIISTCLFAKQPEVDSSWQLTNLVWIHSQATEATPGGCRKPQRKQRSHWQITGILGKPSLFLLDVCVWVGNQETVKFGHHQKWTNGVKKNLWIYTTCNHQRDWGIPQCNTNKLGGGNSNIWNFHPEPWGFMIQFDDCAYFSNGWFNHQLVKIGIPLPPRMPKAETAYYNKSRWEPQLAAVPQLNCCDGLVLRLTPNCFIAIQPTSFSQIESHFCKRSCQVNGVWGYGHICWIQRFLFALDRFFGSKVVETNFIFVLVGTLLACKWSNSQILQVLPHILML